MAYPIAAAVLPPGGGTQLPRLLLLPPDKRPVCPEIIHEGKALLLPPERLRERQGTGLTMVALMVGHGR